MELNQMHYFVEVAKTGNITKAAQALFITQPALSRVILRLEQEMGTPLFDRHGGRVTLNEHGKVFLRYIEPALESINAGVHAVQSELGSKEILIHNYLPSDLFKYIVERCQAEFVDMIFTVKNLGDNVAEEGLEEGVPDIVLLPTKEFRSYIFPLSFVEQWVVIYNCKYEFKTVFDGRAITMEQLAEEPIMFSGSQYDREFVEGAFSEAGLKPNLIVCKTLAESSAQINRGKGVALVPASNFRSLIKGIDSIPISAALISDASFRRMLYLGRSPKFLSNQDEYKVLESIKSHLSKEYAETEQFLESYFGDGE